MVLITAENEEGKTVRVCGANCYNAKGDVCHCVCGGRNHGIGYEAAKARTLAEADAIIAEHNDEFGDLEVKIKI